jgi:nucleoside-diphosphate kinase
MTPHRKTERTLVVIKPDGVQRALMGDIIHRYERSGLKLVALKMLRVTEEFIEKHYTLDPAWRRLTGEKTIKSYLDRGVKPPIDDPLKVTEALLKKLSSYMASGPVIAMVWEGTHAVAVVRKITGGTEPLMAAIGTIRGDFLVDSYEVSDIDNRTIRNLVHASGTVTEARMEIDHWFTEAEIIPYTHHREQILYGHKLEGIF